MLTQSRCFECGRSIVLGALYDTLDKLKWMLISANSDTGIIVAAERVTGMPFLLRVHAEQPEHVEVTMELASGGHADRDSPEASAERFLETMAQIIRNAIGGC